MPPAMSFLNVQIRRTIWLRLATAAVFVGGVAIGAVASARYYLNYFTGPQLVDGKTMAGARIVADLPRYFVTVRGDDVVPTEWQHVTIEQSNNGQEISRKVDSAYVVLVVGDKRLFVRTERPSDKEQTGELEEIPDFGNEDRQVYAKLGAGDPETARRFLPMMLDAKSSF